VEVHSWFPASQERFYRLKWTKKNGFSAVFPVKLVLPSLCIKMFISAFTAIMLAVYYDNVRLLFTFSSRISVSKILAAVMAYKHFICKTRN